MHPRRVTSQSNPTVPKKLCLIVTRTLEICASKLKSVRKRPALMRYREHCLEWKSVSMREEQFTGQHGNCMAHLPKSHSPHSHKFIQPACKWHLRVIRTGVSFTFLSLSFCECLYVCVGLCVSLGLGYHLPFSLSLSVSVYMCVWVCVCLSAYACAPNLVCTYM